MKKKILFIMPSMFIGGAERSLLGLLQAIDYNRIEVSLFLFRHIGEFMKYIPEQVKLLPKIDAYATFDVPIISLLFSRQFLFGIARCLSKVALKCHRLLSREPYGVWMSMQYTSRYLQPLLPKIPGEYDLAIMYLGVADTLVNKVTAKTKLTWCHTDYDSLGPSRKMDLKTYRDVDKIVAVSEQCGKLIKATYPQLTSKIIEMENILSKDLISQQASEPILDMPREKGQCHLLSIGRYSYAKNFDNIPEICKHLLREGLQVKWFIIGYGCDEPLLKRKICEAGMEKNVILLGKRENPYPYIAACDVYVQPSRYEGKCVAVREAQMLGKPVIITNYPTSGSQLEDGVDGLIVPLDNEGCAAGIAAALRNPPLLARLAETCRRRDYSNAQEIQKLYDLIE